MRLSDLQSSRVVAGDPLDAGQGVAAGDFDLAHVADVEEAGARAHREVLVGDAAVFDRHLPSAKWDHAGASATWRANSGVRRRADDSTWVIEARRERDRTANGTMRVGSGQGGGGPPIVSESAPIGGPPPPPQHLSDHDCRHEAAGGNRKSEYRPAAIAHHGHQQAGRRPPPAVRLSRPRADQRDVSSMPTPRDREGAPTTPPLSRLISPETTSTRGTGTTPTRPAGPTHRHRHFGSGYRRRSSRGSSPTCLPHSRPSVGRCRSTSTRSRCRRTAPVGGAATASNPTSGSTAAQRRIAEQFGHQRAGDAETQRFRPLRLLPVEGCDDLSKPLHRLGARQPSADPPRVPFVVRVTIRTQVHASSLPYATRSPFRSPAITSRSSAPCDRSPEAPIRRHAFRTASGPAVAITTTLPSAAGAMPAVSPNRTRPARDGPARTSNPGPPQPLRHARPERDTHRHAHELSARHTVPEGVLDRQGRRATPRLAHRRVTSAISRPARPGPHPACRASSDAARRPVTSVDTPLNCLSPRRHRTTSRAARADGAVAEMCLKSVIADSERAAGARLFAVPLPHQAHVAARPLPQGLVLLNEGQSTFSASPRNAGGSSATSTRSP